MNQVNIIGLGYIGLPTALMLAGSHVPVIGTDYDEKLVAKLAVGELTFTEDGLPELFAQAKDNIVFDTNYHAADCYIVAVPTPYLKASKKIDVSYVLNAVTEILNYANDNAVLIIESTISPGTIDRHIRPLIEQSEKIIHLAHAPERILPGNMISELRNNSRTIGVDSTYIGEKIKTLYQSFCKADIVLTDIRTAEMTKVVENTFRDINIAFANELAQICYVDNMDVNEIIRIANLHPRVNILQPGPGVGGHCISVDPWFLVGDYPDTAHIIRTARKINDNMPSYVLKRIRNIMKENNIHDISKVGLYGLTYKEDVDDVRESPTLQMLEIMEQHLAWGVKCYDPYINSQIVDNQYFDFNLFLAEIELIVIMVGHQQIKLSQDKLKGKLVFDTRSIYKGKGVYTI